jgi:hypothetical protein
MKSVTIKNPQGDMLIKIRHLKGEYVVDYSGIVTDFIVEIRDEKQHLTRIPCLRSNPSKVCLNGSS